MTMTWDEAPEQYWHCYVALPGRKKDRDRAVVNDLGKQQLKREIIDPWCEGRAFTVGGTIVRDRDSVEEIRIVQTPRPKEDYAREHDSRMRASGIADLATDRRFLPSPPPHRSARRLLRPGDPGSPGRGEVHSRGQPHLRRGVAEPGLWPPAEGPGAPRAPTRSRRRSWRRSRTARGCACRATY